MSRINRKRLSPGIIKARKEFLLELEEINQSENKDMERLTAAMERYKRITKHVNLLA